MSAHEGTRTHERTKARTKARRGRSVRATIRPGLQRAAAGQCEEHGGVVAEQADRGGIVDAVGYRLQRVRGHRDLFGVSADHGEA